MPLYNGEAFVAEAVRSVLDQTDRDFELIIYDDGSTDRGAAVASRLIEDDRRACMVRAAHQGLGATLRDAFAMARGELIGQIDADDRLHPKALALCRRALEKRPDAGYVYTRHRRIDINGNVLGGGTHDRVPFDKNKMLIDFLTPHFRLYRKAAYDAVGGWDSSLKAATDYELCLRLVDRFPVCHVPRVLYDYRQHPGSISAAFNTLQRDLSLRAVNASLARRGQADRYHVVSSADGKFRLGQKPGVARALVEPS